MASVNWTQRALTALDGIYDYIHYDAPFYAARFTQQLLNAVDRLETFPLSGRPVAEAERDDIREVIYQNYRIIYWVVSGNQVHIISVLHGSRDLSSMENKPWDNT